MIKHLIHGVFSECSLVILFPQTLTICDQVLLTHSEKIYCTFSTSLLQSPAAFTGMTENTLLTCLPASIINVNRAVEIIYLYLSHNLIASNFIV